MPRPRKYASPAARQAAYRARCRALAPPASVPALPGYRRWEVLLQRAQHCLDQMAEEMAVYWEERSERWQDSERGETFSERFERVEELREQLGDLLEA